MQALARPKVLLTLALFISLFVVGLVFLKGPLETLSLQVTPFAHVFGYPLRGTVVHQWLGMATILLVVWLGTRNMTMVPGRMQALVETIVELFLELCQRAAGLANGRRFFPVVTTIFLFVLGANWLGFLPGVATVGTVEHADEIIHHAEEEHEDLAEVELLVLTEGGNVPIGLSYTLGGERTTSYSISAAEYLAHEEELHAQGLTAGHIIPFLRPANTDVNTPFAIAVWSFLFVEFWGISTLGIGYFGKFFNFGQLLRGKPMGAIDVFVGIVDLIGELARLISFTFRLFGNVLAGEVLIIMATFFVPLVLVNLVFVMELFFGAIQAFIFAILTLIFGIIAVTSHSHPEGEHAPAAGEHEHGGAAHEHAAAAH